MTAELDPRMLEIHFLSELERQGTTAIVPSEVAKKYGTTEERLRHMILHLLAEECLVGRQPPRAGGSYYTDRPIPPQAPRIQVWARLSLPVDDVVRGSPFEINITHNGRLRLFRLQDEMNRRRIRDPFGILIDGRHFEEDLLVRIWMLPAAKLLTVMMADLDHFKAVNDELGHDKGDEYLRRYLQIVRATATTFVGEAYRTGGDETITVFSDLTVDGARDAAERLRAAVEREFEDAKGHLQHPPTASIGAVTYQTAPADPSVVKKAVDEAQYVAKKAGKNRVEQVAHQ